VLLCCDKICCFEHCQHIYDIKKSRTLLALFSLFLVILLFWNANLYHTHRFTHNKILTAITGSTKKVGGPRNFMRGPENFIVPPPFNFYFNPWWYTSVILIANVRVWHGTYIGLDTNMTDRQADTARRQRPRLCITSRGENQSDIQKNTLLWLAHRVRQAWCFSTSNRMHWLHDTCRLPRH